MQHFFLFPIYFQSLYFLEFPKDRIKGQRVNSLPKKILYWSKLKAFADDIINLNEKLKLVLGRLENIVGKGENSGNQHFLLFQQCFQNLPF